MHGRPYNMIHSRVLRVLFVGLDMMQVHRVHLGDERGEQDDELNLSLFSLL